MLRVRMSKNSRLEETNFYELEFIQSFGRGEVSSGRFYAGSENIGKIHYKKGQVDLNVVLSDIDRFIQFKIHFV